MKYILMMILNNLLSVGLGGGAIYLAINNIKGWGWFLVGALLTSVTHSYKSKDSDKENK